MSDHASQNAVIDPQLLTMDLYKACKAADKAAISHLVEAGADINALVGPAEDLNRCLTIAVNARSIEFTQHLLNHGACPQVTAIQAAASNGDAAILQVLLRPIKSQFQNPENGFSKTRWRKDLARILVLAMELGQTSTADILFTFRGRISHERWQAALKTGLTAAAKRLDHASIRYIMQRLGTDDEYILDVLDIVALQIVASHGRPELLVEFVQTYNSHADTITLAAPLVAGAGDLKTLEALLSKGAQDSGKALLSSVKNRHPPITKRLLQRFQYSKNLLSTALCESAKSGDVGSMMLLLEAHAEPGNALQEASKLDQVQPMEVLIKQCKPDHATLSAALADAMFAWVHRQEDSISGQVPPSIFHEPAGVTLLKAHGAEVPEDIHLRMMELMIVLGNETGVRAMLTALPELETDMYLLSLAIYHRHESVTALLLKSLQNECDSVASGEDAELRSTIKRFNKPHPTPLLMAVMTDNQDLCQRILRASTDDRDTWCEYKPSEDSHYVLRLFRHENFKCLLNAFGSNYFLASPLMQAVKSKNREMVKVLLDYGADPWLHAPGNSILQHAALSGTLRDLVFWPPEAAHLYVNRREAASNRTILHWAAAYGDIDTMETDEKMLEPSLVVDLIKQGADINARSSEKATPLHLAIQNASLRSVKELCWAGADINSRNDYGLAILNLHGTAVEYAEWAAANLEARTVASHDTLELRKRIERRIQIAEFLRTYSCRVLDPELMRKQYDEYVAAAARERQLGRAVDEADEELSQLGDDDSLHLSDDGNDDDDNDETADAEGGDARAYSDGEDIAESDSDWVFVANEKPGDL